MRRLRVGACLSLSGRHARFGLQAARGLEVWQSLDGAADLTVEDDMSDPGTLPAVLRSVAARCEVLLGPYSTQLARVAGRVAADAGWLLWNHGGSGDDVEAAHPGHVVSVPTPASRYAEPFIRRLAERPEGSRLLISHGMGSFARQVAAGAAAAARRLGIDAIGVGRAEKLSDPDVLTPWDLMTAGTFEEDVETVRRARALAEPPRLICAVAAGVREFGEAIPGPDGIYGIGQWFPGVRRTPDLGPPEAEFLAAYVARYGTVPDYPAVQAAAGAVLAGHCARHAGAANRESIWQAASALDALTLFGSFKINPDGAQAKHETVLVRWAANRLALA